MVDRYTDKNDDEKDKTIQLRFIDNFKFMASSMDSLTFNLVENCLVLRIIQSYDIIYLPEKAFIHLSICRPGINSRSPNSLP